MTGQVGVAGGADTWQTKSPLWTVNKKRNQESPPHHEPAGSTIYTLQESHDSILFTQNLSSFGGNPLTALLGIPGAVQVLREDLGDLEKRKSTQKFRLQFYISAPRWRQRKIGLIG